MAIFVRIQMTKDNYEQWLQEEKEPFKGWDFSYLGDRVVHESLPWDYQALARKALDRAQIILEMATGGGEKFSELAPFRGKKVFAIESHHLSYLLAKKRLEPLGVKVIEMKGSRELDFEDNYFDLVLNRHGGFRSSEIARILKPGGYFLTQQVSANNWDDLKKEFNAPMKWPDRLPDIVSEELKQCGMIIERLKSWNGKVVFKDVGALVFMLKAVPWTVEGFSVDKYRKVLERLKKRVDKDGKLIFTDRRYLIGARKAV